MDIHVAESLQHLYLNLMPESSLVSSVHRPGQLIIDEDNLLAVNQVLFDTGALHGNYISSSFVKNNIEVLQPFLYPCNGMVRLADNKTMIKIDKLCIITHTHKLKNMFFMGVILNPRA